jgi:uncharacterized membrane protein YphA (DoxX/SURF4 family)
MGDILVTLMGVMDLIAGILIMVGFNFKTFSIILGALMIIKGIISFNFHD